MNLFMNGRLLLIIGSALLGMASPVMAQNSSDQTHPPTPPYVKPPPDDATWTMSVLAPDGSQLPLSPAPATGKPIDATVMFSQELREQDVQQTGKIRQEIDTWSDGTKTEDWIVNGIRLHQHPISHRIFVLDPAHMGAFTAAFFSRNDFLTIAWPSIENYVGAENYQKHLCYHFAKTPPSLPGGQNDSQQAYQSRQLALAQQGRVSGQAWVDVTTKQMIAYNDGTKLYVYVYGPPPAADLVLPPDYAKAWKQYQDTIDPLKLHLPSTK